MDKEKFTELNKQLGDREGSIIIFVKTKRSADQLAKMLRHENHKSEAIHGDLSQRQRDRVILSFRKSNHRLTVATDVAARGLDIPLTQHVINYDLPMSPEDFLHRIGRTGRVGATVNALSFISPDDVAKWRAIDRLINQGESTPRSDFRNAKNNRKRSFGNDRRTDSPPNKKFGSFNNNKRSFDGNNNNYSQKRSNVS